MEICPQRHQNYLEIAAVQKTLNVVILSSPQYNNEAENQKDAKLTKSGTCPAETEPSKTRSAWTMAERDAGVGDSPSPAGVPGLGPPMSSAHLWPGCCGPGLGRQGLRQEHFKAGGEGGDRG